jgi:hypothetical protein
MPRYFRRRVRATPHGFKLQPLLRHFIKDAGIQSQPRERRQKRRVIRHQNGARLPVRCRWRQGGANAPRGQVAGRQARSRAAANDNAVKGLAHDEIQSRTTRRVGEILAIAAASCAGVREMVYHARVFNRRQARKMGGGKIWQASEHAAFCERCARSSALSLPDSAGKVKRIRAILRELSYWRHDLQKFHARLAVDVN